ncbi:MAG: sugar ABC transporter ATP-binding protein [Clostridiaceae bacterium]|nr:sugar ABC transporter ATP-binding protein [Clostridiaceae bacterium]
MDKIKTNSETVFLSNNIKKYYGPTKANDGISFNLKKGEIRGLAGENGSGKSTLISIISGITQKDSGEMKINGQLYQPKSPLDAHEFRIGTVVQELGLVDGLTAGMNVYIGQTEQFTKFGIMDMKRLYKTCEELFSYWGFDNFPIREMTKNLTVEEKKIVELIRALSVDPQILILDEITQALSHNNRTKLYNILDRVTEEGMAVVVITHDIEEMLNISDSITVLLDGRVVGDYQASEITLDELKQKMVGRIVDDTHFRPMDKPHFKDEIVMEVRSVSGSKFQDISFDLHKGQVLGFCGLSDAGIHELGEALYGVEHRDSGEVKLTKNQKVIHTQQDAIKNNVSYLPKDRDKNALMVNDTIKNNVSLAVIDELIVNGFLISDKKANIFANKVIEDYQVKTQSREQIIRGLSGGNRQKVSLGRWLALDNDILILDCPTRGVDVGVKAYIYTLLNELKDQEKSIILISDELPELIGMCDIIYIMKNGKIVKEVHRGPEMIEENIIEEMI